jgi:hypothetical protein
MPSLAGRHPVIVRHFPLPVTAGERQGGIKVRRFRNEAEVDAGRQGRFPGPAVVIDGNRLGIQFRRQFPFGRGENLSAGHGQHERESAAQQGSYLLHNPNIAFFGR